MSDDKAPDKKQPDPATDENYKKFLAHLGMYVPDEDETDAANESYQKFLARMDKEGRRNRIHEIIIGTSMYFGLGLFMTYEYLITGMNERLTLLWWVIGGWMYYKWGIKRWR